MYAKPGFTIECKQASRSAKAVRHRWQQNGETECQWEQYKKARNHLGHVVAKAMKDQYRKEIEERCGTPESMWKACKWARNRTPREACLPALHEHPPMLPETDSAKKALILFKKFFPPPPTVDLTDIQAATYNQNLVLKEIQLHEVTAAIVKRISNKAPGDDGITNRVWKWINDIIALHLQRIFNASLDEGYCAEHCRKSVTISLRKPQKEFYSLASSCRPIALLNTISKLMEYILAKRISFLAEEHNLLPRTHLGARKGVSTEHALHYMVERIHAAWSQGKISTALLLDVMGAFENMARERLLHNLRMKRIDEKIVRWIDAFLSHRMTILKTGEYDTEWLGIFVGIPQGSPISPILFLFYNAPLPEELARRGIHTNGFVDNISVLADGHTPEECNEILVKIHEEICVPWALTHGVKFAPAKYQHIHFSRKKSVDVTAPIRILGSNDIKPRREVKYLGAIMDTKLNWKAHVSQHKTKALKSIRALRSLSGTTWGAKLSRMRQMVQVVFISQLTYACSVWYIPKGDKGHCKGVVKSLASVQYQAERAITGAYRATSKEALNIEVNSMLMHLRLDRLTSAAAVRMITSPAHETIIQGRSTRKPRVVSPLERLVARFEKTTGIRAQAMEKITPFAAPPWWMPPTIRIMRNKEEAEKDHKRQLMTNPANYIYTDGSGINNEIGAAAVSTETNPTTTRAYLGPSTSHTVYSAESYEIVLAASMRLHSFLEPATKPKLIVCADNQAAIRALHNPGASSGQYLVKWIVWLINNLRSRNIEVELHWVPAYIDIEGNEQADIAAKQATGWRLKGQGGRQKEVDTNCMAQQARVQILKSAVKTVVDKTIQQQGAQEWRDCDKGRTLYKIAAKPHKSVLRLHENLTNRLSNIAIQLRTAKIGLREFLYSRKQVDSPMCSCMLSKQTVKHVLFQCKSGRLKKPRRGLWDEETRKAEFGVLRVEEILTSPVSLKKAATFIEESGLIGYLRAPIEDDEE